jgi:hypothetical protein
MCVPSDVEVGGGEKQCFGVRGVELYGKLVGRYVMVGGAL